MLRETMMSTMPVAMTAMDALCTERFHKLREVRKSPPDRKWNPVQMITSATTIPAKRVSISVEAMNERARSTTPVLGTCCSLVWVSLTSSAPCEEMNCGSNENVPPTPKGGGHVASQR